MSAFYDLASLVLVPSGTKAQKIYAQKPQTTDGQLAFSRSTTATRVNSAGLIEASAINVPRLDYLNSSCPRLLLEPQRTNLITFSEQINNAAWNNVRGTITANSTISPSGLQDADTFATAPAQAYPPALTRSPTYAGNTNYTLSIFAKKLGNTNLFSLGYVDNSTGFTGGSAIYNLATQVVTITQSPNASVTASMQDYGNGWYRLVLSFLTIATPTYDYFQMGQTTNDVANGFALWGCQLEAGAYATSYIPTLGAAVTRGLDVCGKTGIGSLFGTNAGTIYFETIYDPATNLGGGERWVYAQGNTSSDFVRLWQDVTGGGKKIRALVYSGGVQYANIITTATSLGLSDTASSTIKFAFAYEDNRFQMYVNGINAGIDTSGTAPTITEITFNSTAQTIFPLAQFLVFPTALTNAQMAELTA